MSTTVEALSDVLESTQRPSPMPSVDHAGRAAQPRQATAALAPSRCWRRDAGRRLARRRRARSAAVQGEERGGSRGGAGRGARSPSRRSAGSGGASTAREGAWGGMRFFLLRRSLFLFLLYFLLAVQDIPCTRIYVATRTESRLQSQDTRRCNWRSIWTNRMRATHFLRGGERPTCWRLRAAHALVDAGRPEWAWPVFVGRGGGRCFCGLCNCYINCTLLHFSLAIYIYIYIYITKTFITIPSTGATPKLRESFTVVRKITHSVAPPARLPSATHVVAPPPV